MVLGLGGPTISHDHEGLSSIRYIVYVEVDLEFIENSIKINSWSFK